MEKFSNEFDATRSTGYLCAATVQSFEQVRSRHKLNIAVTTHAHGKYIIFNVPRGNSQFLLEMIIFYLV